MKEISHSYHYVVRLSFSSGGGGRKRRNYSPPSHLSHSMCATNEVRYFASPSSEPGATHNTRPVVESKQLDVVSLTSLEEGAQNAAMKHVTLAKAGAVQERRIHWKEGLFHRLCP